MSDVLPELLTVALNFTRRAKPKRKAGCCAKRGMTMATSLRAKDGVSRATGQIQD
jgi:hypothetical protein